MSRIIFNTIIQAINEKKSLNLVVKHGSGKNLNITCDPYILGDDTLQYEFLWAFLSNNGLYYKFRIENIVKVEITNNTFSVQKDALYLYAIEEEHLAIVDGIHGKLGNIYRQGIVDR